MEPLLNHGDVHGAVLIVLDDDVIEDSDALAAMARNGKQLAAAADNDGIEDSDALSSMSVNGQPSSAAVDDDDDPEFQRRMQMAIALSV